MLGLQLTINLIHRRRRRNSEFKKKENDTNNHMRTTDCRLLHYNVYDTVTKHITIA